MYLQEHVSKRFVIFFLFHIKEQIEDKEAIKNKLQLKVIHIKINFTYYRKHFSYNF